MAKEEERGAKKPAGIKAGAIRFDELGRIIIDPQVQSEMGGFQLPPWSGGPGTGGGGGVVVSCPDAACEPESICGDVNCVPEGMCTDVNCQPESVCTDVDAFCEPESACADVNCVPEGMCTDVNCVPEGMCTDAACQPESICTDTKCVDIFCGDRNKDCETNMECGGGDDVVACADTACEIEVEPM